MVPFAEVVLLTAMEYQREDQSDDVTTKTKLIVVAAKADEGEEENKSEETLWMMHGFPQLKTIGLKSFLHLKHYGFNSYDFHISKFFREKTAAFSGAGKLHCLFCVCSNLLL